MVVTSSILNVKVAFKEGETYCSARKEQLRSTLKKNLRDIQYDEVYDGPHPQNK